ncbi:MAG TPA: alpha/beta hydrolase [Acidimicrobiia bacterium]|nr:alpha/beta hydrolase [Acidimicrobiia bacterium]
MSTTTSAPQLDTQRQTFETARLDLLARHGFEAASRWITDARGRRIYAMERGKGDCPRILIHGGISEGSEWWPIAARLGGRTLIADRPGFGLSCVPDPARSFRASALEWMETLVAGLGAPKVDLIGNSLGGYTSLVYALAHPDRVRRLVLVGAPAGLHRRVPLLLRLWGNPLAGRLITARPISDPEQLRKILGSILVVDARNIPRQELEVMVAGGLLPGVPRYTFEMLKEITDLGGFRRKQLIMSEVANLATPTRFVWGDEDAFCTPAAAVPVWDRMSQAELVEISGAGHLPQFDRPDEVGDAVVEFLDS